VSGIGKGCVHIYTGNGKGKTTAALGLALRAAGHGLKTIMVQFMKGQHYGELDSVKNLGGLVTIEQFGHPQFCRLTDPPDEADVKRAQAAIERIKKIIREKGCDILVLDEVMTAIMFNLITEAQVYEIIRSRPSGMEIVLTGRSVNTNLYDAADLVTEMQDIKHYYHKGVQARKGIES
jgi:cob(I)alamin adenosyltransferase